MERKEMWRMARTMTGRETLNWVPMKHSVAIDRIQTWKFKRPTELFGLSDKIRIIIYSPRRRNKTPHYSHFVPEIDCVHTLSFNHCTLHVCNTKINLTFVTSRTWALRKLLGDSIITLGTLDNSLLLCKRLSMWNWILNSLQDACMCLILLFFMLNLRTLLLNFPRKLHPSSYTSELHITWDTQPSEAAGLAQIILFICDSERVWISIAFQLRKLMWFGFLCWWLAGRGPHASSLEARPTFWRLPSRHIVRI